MNDSIDTLDRKQRNRLIGGLVLIGFGVYLLAAQFFQAAWMGNLILPVLGLAFSLWGLVTRNGGLLVPGGILSGIALGTVLVTGPYAGATGETQGGVFLLAFAAGWALIAVLSLVIGRLQLWPLIPGGILALIGGLLLGGATGLQMLEWLGRLWPLALIAGGVAALLRVRRP